MVPLPVANILHHKVRSTLSVLGIGLGLCMLITLSGLARGSLSEVADRWEAIDADLIIYPPGWGDNITTLSGLGLPDRLAAKVARENAAVIEHVVPVFFWQVKFAGQDQMVAGVDAGDFPVLTRGRALVKGRLFGGGASQWDEFIERLRRERTASLSEAQQQDYVLDITEDDLAKAGWLDLVIDDRLAQAGKLHVGDAVEAANHHWRVVGIAPRGVSSRVFMPRQTAQFLFGAGDTAKSTLALVKLKADSAGKVDAEKAALAIRRGGVDVIHVNQYRGKLQQKFGVMFRYVDAVNTIALAIAFLFIMNTLYTMVLQRTRDIAILKSCGASGAFVLWQVLAESLLLSALGAAVGIGLSFLAAWLIETLRPLLTVTITWPWIALALAAAAAGAILSSLYPAWRATRVDMVEVLTLE